MGNRILLFPYGGNSREACAAIAAQREAGVEVEFSGFIDDNFASLERRGVTLLGDRSAWPSLREAGYKLLAVPGSPESYSRREQLIASLELRPGDMTSIVDPSVRQSESARIGLNTLILAFSFLGASSEVGNHCVLLSHVVVSHDVKVGDFSLIGAGACISGGAIVGKGCYIGASSSIISGVTIGDGALVGIGANVINDVPARAVVAGNPARILRYQL